jgi:hypothetical protein
MYFLIVIGFVIDPVFEFVFGVGRGVLLLFMVIVLSFMIITQYP